MKKVLKLKIKRWINDKLVSNKEKLICGYCESTQIFKVRNKDAYLCRVCGKESRK